MKKYQSKLLLFGEYTAVLGGEVLAIPFPKYNGRFRFLAARPTTGQQHLQAQFKEFANFLVAKGTSFLDLSLLKKDLAKGIFFDSNIPQGYGAGSSGALCAAIYGRYAKEKTSDIQSLKAIFAEMESYFHGSSSGVDPLIAYMDSGLHLKDKNDFELVDISMDFLAGAGFFLVDTKMPRKTQPLVDFFLERCKDPVYQKKCKEELAVYNQAAIKATLGMDLCSLRASFRSIAEFQFEHFQRMIPNDFQELWKNGLTSGDYAIKICGAGGGGFLLGLKMKESDLKFDFNCIDA